MRFGTFIPQGWRLDLVGIDPADQWRVMSTLAQQADEGPWESLWVYDHFHTIPVADRGGDARGVDPDGGVRRVDQPHPPRPDVHVHGLPQPRLPREGRRDRRRHLGRPRRDGHRRRLVRARVARVRLRLPAGPGAPRGCCAKASRSCTRPGRPARPPSTASTTRSTARSCGRCPLQEGGIPLWVAGGGEKVTLKIAAQYAAYTNFAGSIEEFDRKSEILPRALRRARPRLRGDHALVELQHDRRRDRGRGSRSPRRGEGATAARSSAQERADAIEHDYRTSDGFGSAEQVAERLARARRARARLRDPLLPRGGVRPLGHRAVRARGHRRAGLSLQRVRAVETWRRARRVRARWRRQRERTGRQPAAAGLPPHQGEHARVRVRRSPRASTGRRRRRVRSRCRWPRTSSRGRRRARTRSRRRARRRRAPRGGASPAIAGTPSASRQSNQNGTSRQCTAQPIVGDGHEKRYTQVGVGARRGACRRCARRPCGTSCRSRSGRARRRCPCARGRRSRRGTPCASRASTPSWPSASDAGTKRSLSFCAVGDHRELVVGRAEHERLVGADAGAQRRRASAAG